MLLVLWLNKGWRQPRLQTTPIGFQLFGTGLSSRQVSQDVPVEPSSVKTDLRVPDRKRQRQKGCKPPGGHANHG